MIVRAERGIASMGEPRDLRSLSLEPIGSRETALGSWGRWVDEAHVVVPVGVLIALAGDVADEPGWREGFDAMIEHATRSGWVDRDGGVRMHVR